jgi:hypothetical protein
LRSSFVVAISSGVRLTHMIGKVVTDFIS